VSELKLDFVTRDEAGAFNAYLVDTEPCGGDMRLTAVAERLEAAINWIAAGGMAQQFPEAAGERTRLIFEYVETPDAQGRALLERAEAAAAGAGVELVTRAQGKA
jgi:hypothetical protein